MRLISRLIATGKVIRFYLPATGTFLRCLFDKNLTLSSGAYELFSGHTLPVFFSANAIPLEWISVGGLKVEETMQADRVRTVLKHYPEHPADSHLHGRNSQRIYSLVDARIRGTDDFVVLLERKGPKSYIKIDGATRLAVLHATGARSVQAFITLRGESRF